MQMSANRRGWVHPTHGHPMMMLRQGMLSRCNGTCRIWRARGWGDNGGNSKFSIVTTMIIIVSGHVVVIIITSRGRVIVARFQNRRTLGSRTAWTLVLLNVMMNIMLLVVMWDIRATHRWSWIIVRIMQWIWMVHIHTTVISVCKNSCIWRFQFFWFPTFFGATSSWGIMVVVLFSLLSTFCSPVLKPYLCERRQKWDV